MAEVFSIPSTSETTSALMKRASIISTRYPRHYFFSKSSPSHAFVKMAWQYEKMNSIIAMWTYPFIQDLIDHLKICMIYLLDSLNM